MDLTAWATAAVLSLPRPIDGHETAAEWRERAALIGQAVATEAASAGPRRRELAAAVLTVWFYESALRRDVHAGERLGDGGRAICLGQLHRSGITPEWPDLAGLDLEATRRCARATIRALRGAWFACSDGATVDRAAVLAGYGIGHCVEPPGWARTRAATWARLAAR